MRSLNKNITKIALSFYVGESCKYCGFTAKNVDDLYNKSVVWVGNHSKGRWACKKCFDNNKRG